MNTGNKIVAMFALAVAFSGSIRSYFRIPAFFQGGCIMPALHILGEPDMPVLLAEKKAALNNVFAKHGYTPYALAFFDEAMLEKYAQVNKASQVQSDLSDAFREIEQAYYAARGVQIGSPLKILEEDRAEKIMQDLALWADQVLAEVKSLRSIIAEHSSTPEKAELKWAYMQQWFRDTILPAVTADFKNLYGLGTDEHDLSYLFYRSNIRFIALIEQMNNAFAQIEGLSVVPEKDYMNSLSSGLQDVLVAAADAGHFDHILGASVQKKGFFMNGLTDEQIEERYAEMRSKSLPDQFPEIIAYIRSHRNQIVQDIVLWLVQNHLHTARHIADFVDQEALGARYKQRAHKLLDRIVAGLEQWDAEKETCTVMAE